MNINKNTQEEKKEELLEFFNNPAFAHFIGIINPPRPGIMLCFVKLELIYLSDKIDSYEQCFLQVWNSNGVIAATISVLQNKFNLVEKAAAQSGLKIIYGVPEAILCAETNMFFRNNGTIFTFENIPDYDIYTGNQKKIDQLLEKQKREIDKIIKNARKNAK